ncbi:MAG TPA: hypothetical protein VHB70_01155 [Parafilimonas sp.]|nr:hypothetical protein [Parafilimonas sp.]
MKKMKKIYPLLLFLFFHSYFCFSQQPPNEDDDQRIDVIKMAYISQELNLSPQEAQNFWPVYNNYQNEIKQARNQYPNDEVAYEKKVVEIKQRYQPNFKKVLGNNGQRLNKVYTTDRKFHDMMRNELQKRQQQRQQQDFQQKPNQQQHPPRNMGNGNGQKRQINKINGGGGKPKHHRF